MVIIRGIFTESNSKNFWKLQVIHRNFERGITLELFILILNIQHQNKQLNARAKFKMFHRKINYCLNLLSSIQINRNYHNVSTHRHMQLKSVEICKSSWNATIKILFLATGQIWAIYKVSNSYLFPKIALKFLLKLWRMLLYHAKRQKHAFPTLIHLRVK